ncbi:MAG: hypothetical protein PHO80_03085 [Candidatus Gracilibacteria bacterium]|nr:hypothetical protein [Candidatus Gracilibacteria bacterium]
MIGNQTLLKSLSEILKTNGLIPEINNNENLYNFFNYINNNKEKFNNSFLLNYLYRNISSDDVSKRKTTARDFEDFLGIVLGGKITDETIRTNDTHNSLFVENDFITSFVKSNKREKIDIEFNNNYGFSIKTLMFDNREINFGSFEKKALFYDFGINEFLDERKGKSGIGLGSKPQLKKLFEIIEKNGEYERFRKRFLHMFKYIFSDDILIAIKNNLIMDIYIINGNDFYQLLENNSSSKEELLTILNRWEGNSIRMDRSKILSISKSIRLEFNFLTDSNNKRNGRNRRKIIKVYYLLHKGL